MSELYFD